jgi:hypothetical protein
MLKMKKYQNKKVKSQIVFISLILVSTFLLIINFIPIFIINAGLTAEFTGGLSRDYSTYVNQSNPDMNYYFDSWSTAIGNSCETYVHFNLELLPKETEKLYFSIESFYSYDPLVEDVEINIILIEASWNASELTWNNKPQHEDIIDVVNASDIVQGFVTEYYNLQKAVDLTDIFKDDQLEEISLCINITENNEELNANVFFSGIHLLWNYKVIILSYTTILTSFLIFSMLIGTIYFLRKDIYTCTNCGAKKVHTDIVCPTCETVFKREQVMKRADYQLTFIVFWIFIFLEGSYLIITSLIHILYPYSFFLTPFILIPWMILCYKLIKKRTKQYKEMKM